MTAQFARAPFRGRSAPGTPSHEPHAALLIDFDNVTMGIRSDLTKELKNLLNSDIIKGKVAVQRAYADWRRYPQYIVPLAESSVDLIFAPAYGSAKKNATDIRLAIDAVELVFTRPEIGTIILLSGDSDFSSLVLKLKEYGKYVIGVGIRESASDLLVQNCDEYYSYSALTGLTRAGDEAQVVSDDPWELVEMALRQMIENDDVMRSDRLKQVLLEMDPGFDEKALGFQKFNKFLQEAANRGLLSLRKQENGQYEVGPPGADAGENAQADREARESRSRRGRRGRGRREDGRDTRDGRDRADRPAEMAVPTEDEDEQPAAAAAQTGPPEAPSEAPAEPAASGPGAPRGREREAMEDRPARSERPPREERAPAAERQPREEPEARAERQPREQRQAGEARQPAAAEPAVETGTGDLAAAYQLLRRATSDLVQKAGGVARDSDVKRRMIELQPGWDETAFGFSKFSRFLRQAHDAEVVTLRRGENGNYDVVPGNADVPEVPTERDSRGRRDRDRGRGRDRDRQRDQPLAVHAGPAVDEAAQPAPGATQATAPAEPAAARQDSAAQQPPEPAPDRQQAAPLAASSQSQSATAARGAPQPAAAVGFRRGSRGRPAASGPPPLLEGQTAAVQRSPAQAAAASPAAEAQKPAEPAHQEGAQPAKKAAKSAGKSARRTPAKTEAAQLEFAGDPGTDGAPATRPAKKAAARKTAKKADGGSRIDAAALGLPRTPGEVASYIAATYRGVGPKSVDALLARFGASRIFDALQNRPDEVREVMGAARGDRLLEAWAADLAARRAGTSDGAAAEDGDATSAAPAEAQGRSRRGRRGGRGRATAK